MRAEATEVSEAARAYVLAVTTVLSLLLIALGAGISFGLAQGHKTVLLAVPILVAALLVYMLQLITEHNARQGVRRALEEAIEARSPRPMVSGRTLFEVVPPTRWSVMFATVLFAFSFLFTAYLAVRVIWVADGDASAMLSHWAFRLVYTTGLAAMVAALTSAGLEARRAEPAGFMVATKRLRRPPAALPPLRVLLVSESLPPRTDGVASVVSALADEVAATRGVTLVAVLGPRGSQLHRSLPLMPVHSIRTRFDGYPFAIARVRRMRRILRQQRVDVVHVHTQGPLGVATTVAAEQLGVAIVTTFHTDLMAYQQHYPAVARLAPLALAVGTGSLRLGARLIGNVTNPGGRSPDLLVNLLVERSVAVIVPSGKMGQRLERCSPGALATILPTPRDPPPARLAVWPSTAAPLAPCPRFVYLGRVAPEKNLDILLDSAELLVAGGRSCTIEVWGAGSHLASFDAEIRSRSLADTVITKGPIDAAEVHTMLLGATALLMPSLTDTQSLVLWEAAGVGVPSVICDRELDDGRNIARIGTTCLLAEGADSFAAAMELLMSDATARATLGDAARELARSVRFTDYAHANIELYRDVSSKRRAGPRFTG